MKRNIKKISVFLTIAALGVLIVFSCKHKAPNAFEFDEICFNTEILPIFQSNCATCHNEEYAEEDYIYTNYNSIMETIKPGDPDGSKAYQYITEIIHDFMPPERPLTINQRTLIRIWIEQGAKETICTTPNDTTIIDESVCFSRDILPILLSSCGTSGCHDDITQASDIVLTNYNSVTFNNEIVKPFNPLNSDLYKILLKSDDSRMPPLPASRLTDEQIALIYDWINEGALDEKCAILCDTTVFTYSVTIDEIITNNCLSCHSGSSPSGDVSLTNYTEVKAIADDGRLVNAINGTGGISLMPTSGSLSDCQITQIEKWVAAGALNNK